VKDQTKTVLFSDKDKQISDHQLFSVVTDKATYTIGDTAALTFASAANIKVTVDVEKDHKTVKTEIIQLNNSKQTISIPVTQNDLGGFVVHYSFAAFNGFESGSLNMSVPYPKTDLNIETLTFRDKLQPGTDETWSFKIKGPKGDKVAAELLASMYDASLDQFKHHDWTFNPIQNPIYYSYSYRNAGQSFGNITFRIQQERAPYYQFKTQLYDQINWFGFYFSENQIARILSGKASGVMITNDDGASGTATNVVIRGYNSMLVDNEAELDEVVVTAQGISREKRALGYAVSEVNTDQAEENPDNYFLMKRASLKPSKSGEPRSMYISDIPDKTDFSGVTIRKNLQETAFFFPHLQTDAEGNVTFSFTTPEALTKWKLQLLAHTKTLESAVTCLETVTQKELMVIPNAPRFLREGDQITISTKIANLTDSDLSGQALLQLFDAVSGKAITNKLIT